MTLFQYRTLQDGKEVLGTIDAPSAQSAQELLQKNAIEATDIQEASRINRPSGSVLSAEPMVQSFAYEGVDASGVTRHGTVQGNTKREAFDRLLSSQKLSLSLLSPLGITPLFPDPDLERWQQEKKSTSSVEAQHSLYTSLLDTLRLYAGWLLVWYTLFSSIGYYSSVRVLPFSIPFSELFFRSLFLSSVALSAFLFLFATSILPQIINRFARYGIALLFIVLFFAMRDVLVS